MLVLLLIFITYTAVCVSLQVYIMSNSNVTNKSIRYVGRLPRHGETQRAPVYSKVLARVFASRH